MTRLTSLLLSCHKSKIYGTRLAGRWRESVFHWMQSKSKYMMSTYSANQPAPRKRRQARRQLNSTGVKSGNTGRGVHRKQREKHSQNSLATVTTSDCQHGKVWPCHCASWSQLCSSGGICQNRHYQKFHFQVILYLQQHRLRSPVIRGTTNSSYCCSCKNTELLYLPFSLLSPGFRVSLWLRYPARALLYHKLSFKIFML